LYWNEGQVLALLVLQDEEEAVIGEWEELCSKFVELFCMNCWISIPPRFLEGRRTNKAPCVRLTTRIAPHFVVIIIYDWVVWYLDLRCWQAHPVEWIAVISINIRTYSVIAL